MNSLHRYMSMVGFLLLTACAAPSGSYVITAVDSGGSPLAGSMHMTATDRGVYTVRNAFCSRYPRAVVTIRSQTTGKELGGESPYQCK